MGTCIRKEVFQGGDLAIVDKITLKRTMKLEANIIAGSHGLLDALF
jgi:hypothetical protein